MLSSARYYQIINKVSGFGLLAGSWGTKPSDTEVWQYPLSETGSLEAIANSRQMGRYD